MAKSNEIYKCSTCGNIVEVLHGGDGDLVCCGEKMELLKENSVDASLEKHVPVIEKKDSGVLIKVGSAPHPMEKEHYIEWIEIMFDGKVDRQYLEPGDKPEAYFNVDSDEIEARIYCNLHGLWKSE
jgi:superoxide reductase